MTDLGLGPGDHRNAHGAPAEPNSAADRAAGLLAAVERATMRLLEAVQEFDDAELRQPSLLPGWTRGHVLAHLARNADGCVNLLVWARTGVEHPMYPSKPDRDAAIDEGADHSQRLQEEDLIASATRFAEACRGLPAAAWAAEVTVAPGKPIQAYQVLRMRLLEVWVHLADLDYGFDFDNIPEPDVEDLLATAVGQFEGRPDVPGVTITVELRDRQRTWTLGRPGARSRQVSGPPGAALGWLLGRSSGERLAGPIPELPTWL
jgi:maleylpyruvate isomerase